MVMDPNRYRKPEGWDSGADSTGGAPPFAARLVFVEYPGRSIQLDCVAGGGGTLPGRRQPLLRGEPFSLSLGLPAHGWRALALVTLERWARDGRPLRVELVSHAESHVAKVSDRQTTVVFDLLAPTGA